LLSLAVGVGVGREPLAQREHLVVGRRPRRRRAGAVVDHLRDIGEI
jgi:hypothetical protein